MSELQTQRYGPRNIHPVDLVAIILACGLVLIAFLIGVSLMINVAEGHNPTPTLGENTTQVLTTVLGGLIGILGGYIGYALHERHNAQS